MPLRIEKDVELEGGLTGASGIYVKYQVIFPSDTLQVEYNMRFYRDKSAYDNGERSIRLKNIRNVYERDLTQTEYNNLDTSTVSQYLKDHLENKLGTGTITIL